MRIIAIMASKMTELKRDISFKYRVIRLGKGKFSVDKAKGTGMSKIN